MATFLSKVPGHNDRMFPCLDRSFLPPKPDPAALVHIANHWGLPAHKVTMVGDTAHDMVAAQEAGMRFVLVRQAYNHDLVISKEVSVITACLTELIELLGAR